MRFLAVLAILAPPIVLQWANPNGLARHWGTVNGFKTIKRRAGGGLVASSRPIQDRDGAAVTVSSQHLGPVGRGGREAVKVVIEQALTLGFRLLGDPAFDGFR